MKNHVSLNKKHWVRLTRLCNNRCVFCLDSEEHDGSVVPAEEVLEALAKGRANGFEQAVLSGGEPTLHPEFFRIVSETKKMGYKWTQTITNGRMFSYAGFINKAIAAGLDEATFSLHSGDAETFETLTRTPASYEESMKGFIRASQTRGLTVSVDILLTGYNAGRLKAEIESLAALGAVEFDILYPIPFGDAWTNRKDIFVDIEKYRDDIIEAFEFCEARGLRAWSNRIPPHLFEGAERFIQKPSKLTIEVEAKKEMFEALANRGIKPPCNGERCSLCHVKDFCESLDSFSTAVASGKPMSILISAGNAPRLSAPLPVNVESLILEDASLLDRDSVKNFLSKNDVRVELTLQEPLENDLLIQDAISVIYIEINKNNFRRQYENEARMTKNADIKYILKGRATLTETLDKEISISEFIEEYVKNTKGDMPALVNVPQCLTGRAEAHYLEAVPADVFNKKGEIDIDKFVGFYIENGMRTKSARCANCELVDQCQGLHINHIRAFGYATIPVRETSGINNKD